MKKYYFISDLHLGAPDYETSLIRERAFVKWLDAVSVDAAAIYIVGDLFDFWFEYKRAVPRGFVRALGKLAELSDRGIALHLFTGNHDMWIFDYLPKELNAKLYREPVIHELNGKKLFIGHGDGLGPGDYGYKIIKKVFANPLMQWCFERLHPNFGIWLADRSSKGSRKKTGDKDAVFLGADKEWLAIYAREKQASEPVDYYIFGHRHLPLDLPIEPGGRYINLGDWIQHFTYGVLEAGDFTLRRWK